MDRFSEIIFLFFRDCPSCRVIPGYVLYRRFTSRKSSSFAPGEISFQVSYASNVPRVNHSRANNRARKYDSITVNWEKKFFKNEIIDGADPRDTSFRRFWKADRFKRKGYERILSEQQKTVVPVGRRWRRFDMEQ